MSIPLDKYISAGRTLFNQGKYDESYEEFDKATQSDSKNAEAWCGKGWALLKQNKFDDKKKLSELNTAFDNATQFDSQNVVAWCGKGLALFKQNKIDKSNEAFNKAIKLNRNIVRKYILSADEYINVGRALFDQNNIDESFKAFDMATQLHPENAEAWCGKGWALCNQNNIDESFKAFDIATRLGHDFAYAWCGKGYALFKQNNIEKSNEAFDKAIKLNPNIIRKYDNEGWNQIKNGRHDIAIKYFETAIQIKSVDKDKQRDPDYAEAWCGKGYALCDPNNIDNDKSYEAFNEAIKLNPSIEIEWQKWGDYLRNKGSSKGAIEGKSKESDEYITIAELYHGIAFLLGLSRQYQKRN